LSEDEWKTVGETLCTRKAIPGAFLPTRNFERLPPEVHDTNLLDDFSLEQFSKLGEKEHKNFEQQVKVMAEKRKKGDEIDASAIAKKKRIKKDEPLDGEETAGRTDAEIETNRDENEQKRLLQHLLMRWQLVNGETDGIEPAEPIFYWEFVISDSYSETVENIFYLSFLIKLKVIRFSDCEDYNAISMAPDYDEIRKSKFGTEGKAKKRSRVKYEASPALLSSTQKLLKRWDKESADLKKEKQSDEVGGAKEISRQGSVTIDIPSWEEWVNYFKHKDAPESWTKMIPSRR